MSSPSRIEIDLKNELDKIPPYHRNEIQSHIALFKKYDLNGDGKISVAEFEKVFQEINRKSRTPRIFPDYNEDGYISIIEFLAFLRGE